MFKNDIDIQAQADQVIDEVGKVKQSTENRRPQNKNLNPSEKAKIVKSKVRAITRAVMRQPNKEVTAQLIFLHGKLKKHFYEMSDKAIEFLLSFNEKEPRGGFVNKVDKTGKIIKSRVEKFKEFLEQNPNEKKPQQLLTKIQSILNAMATLVINNCPEIIGQSDMSQFDMNDKVFDLMELKMVRRVREAYPSRLSDIDPDKNDPFFTAEQEVASSASEVEAEDRYSPNAPSVKFFKKSQDKQVISWPEAAAESGVPIRAHVSATVALLLPALEGLYDDGKIEEKSWFQNDENAKMLAGALLLPTLERANFHTSAETAAGVIFYLNERAMLKENVQRINKPLAPDEAFKVALEMLESAANDQVSEKQKMSLKQAIKITKHNLIEIVETLKSQSSLLEKKLKF